MSEQLPYGYWTFGGRNGLVGGPTTLAETRDGRQIYVPDPELPAVLQDHVILDALQRSQYARDSFCALFPTLDPVSQARLTDLITTHKNYTRLLLSDQAWLDAVQRTQVTAGVHTGKGILP